MDYYTSYDVDNVSGQNFLELLGFGVPTWHWGALAVASQLI
jgi:hypothetical protein